MLKGVSLWLAGKAGTVSLLARRPERLGKVARVQPLAVDYRDHAPLLKQLNKAVDQFGPIELVIGSVDNSQAPEALQQIVECLACHGKSFRLFHVRGSNAAHPDRVPAPGLNPIPELCHYRQVILGWMIEPSSSRWLNHAEICDGVIKAVEQDLSESVVGVVRPWERRPGW